MHIQPEILCAAGVPGQLHDHVALSLWDDTSYENNGGQDTAILSSGVVCKNIGKWNGAVLARVLILSAAL